jgi:hypothetical protein
MSTRGMCQGGVRGGRRAYVQWWPYGRRSCVATCLRLCMCLAHHTPFALNGNKLHAPLPTTHTPPSLRPPHSLTARSCCLVMEFIPGSCLFRSQQAFLPSHLHQTAEDLGRLLTLDMLLGNADRLHCDELSWRGNPGADACSCRPGGSPAWL